MIAAWRDPAASFVAEKEDAEGEPRVLAFAFGAAVFLTLGPVAAEAIRPALALGDERTPWFAARVFIGLSFLPLSLYAAAAALRLICRAFGGSGGWRDTRLALFWSALATGPAAATAHAFSAASGASSVGGALAGLLWIWLLAPMLARAHGFRPIAVFAAFGVLASCVFLLNATARFS